MFNFIKKSFIPVSLLGVSVHAADIPQEPNSLQDTLQQSEEAMYDVNAALENARKAMDDVKESMDQVSAQVIEVLEKLNEADEISIKLENLAERSIWPFSWPWKS